MRLAAPRYAVQYHEWNCGRQHHDNFFMPINAGCGLFGKDFLYELFFQMPRQLEAGDCKWL